MLINGTEDLRIQKTMDAIQKTFEDMICEMDYEKITVKELCERARINKKTFYRYYSTLDDLLTELQGVMIEEYLKRIKNFFSILQKKGLSMKRLPVVEITDTLEAE